MGLFITFEGIEGSGKTTQARMLCDYLRGRGREVVEVREPGGTALGEKVRKALLNSSGEGGQITPFAELFLYEACRAELVARVIRPALAGGKAVVCDRFVDSTVAYQAYARGLPLEAVSAANSWATGGLTPDLTILVDCPVSTGLERAFSRIETTGAAETDREDRFEKEGAEFHERVRKGYLEFAAAEPGRIKTVDGTGKAADVHREVCAMVDALLAARL